MNRPALSALALAAFAVSAKAGDSDTWSGLDTELSKLASSLATNDATPIKVGAWIKTNYINQDNHNPNPDLSGFQLAGVRVTVSGDVAPGYSFKVSVDGASGTAVLKDAYGVVKVADSVNFTMGNFKAPFLFSATDADEKLVFYERTTLGGLWADRDVGAMFNGSFQNFRGYVAAQNGGDGTTERMFLTGKVAWDLVAGKGFAKQEGGFGPNAETAATIAASYADDDSVTKARAWALEAQFASGPIYAQAEYVDYDKGWTTGAIGAGPGKKSSGRADTKPWDIQAAYAFTTEWEAALRFEDGDDSANSKVYGAGLNYYVKGHDAKWQLNVLKVDSDSNTIDATKIELGLTLAI